MGQECGSILILVKVLVRGNNPKLAIYIGSILDHLSYNGYYYHEENNKAMVKDNCYKPFVDFLHNGSKESKLAMVNWLAHFEPNDTRREPSDILNLNST